MQQKSLQINQNYHYYRKNICSYRLRVECMLLKAEFEANMSFLEPSLESMLTAGEGGFNIFFVSVLYLVLLNFDINTKYS